MYIGRQNIYGLFEKQVLDADGVKMEFMLNWQAGSSTSLLVISAGTVLEPGPGKDYNVIFDGRTVVFNAPPLPGTYVLYLGRELSVARTIGIEPILDRFTGDGVNKEFTLSLGPVNGDSIIVFVNGSQQRLTDDYTISGSLITFDDAAIPPASSDISVYIHGVERFDSGLLEPGCVITEYIRDGAVTTQKIADGAVTYNKMNLVWENWDLTSPGRLQTFGGMTIVSSEVTKAQFMRLDPGHFRLKMDFSCIFGGVANNILRYALPQSSVDEICPAAITLTTPSLIETGIQTWGGLGYFDVQRQNGINYTLGETWRFKIRADYDLA